MAPLNVCMVGTGEYTTGFVGGGMSGSDKKVGVVGLTLFDLRKRGKVGKLSMVGTSGTKYGMLSIDGIAATDEHAGSQRSASISTRTSHRLTMASTLPSIPFLATKRETQKHTRRPSTPCLRETLSQSSHQIQHTTQSHSMLSNERSMS